MASSSSSKSRTRSSVADDILIEIFAYLPLNSIYMLRCLSKVWLTNLSSHHFITKWFQINNKSLPWIHYHNTMTHHLVQSYADIHSEFMSKYEHLFSFRFLIDEIKDRVFLLGSSHGLVLCLSVSYNNRRRYHVCNPLTQTWVTLPSPPRYLAYPFHVNGIFCENSSSFTSCFRVVRIPEFFEPSKKINVDIFSSGLGVWESFQVSCDEHVEWGSCNFDKIVILNGVLYWIEGRHRMLVYNINQHNGSDGHRCNLINLPDKEFGYSVYGIFDSHIGESEGWVCYARTKITGKKLCVSVWVLDGVNWQIMHKDISIDNILARFCSRVGDQSARIRVLGFSPVNRNVVMIGGNHWIWACNIQTRSSEELCLVNRHRYDNGKMFLPFVLKPLPTVLPPTSWIDTQM